MDWSITIMFGGNREEIKRGFPPDEESIFRLGAGREPGRGQLMRAEDSTGTRERSLLSALWQV